MKHFSDSPSQSRQPRFAGIALILLISLLASPFMNARAQSGGPPAAPSDVEISQGPTIVAVEMNGSVSNLPDAAAAPELDFEPIDPVFIKTPPGAGSNLIPDAPVLPKMPAATLNFESIKLDDSCGSANCGAGYPPDTVGDVGPSHYIAAVNTAIAIFDKSGTRLALYSFNQLWSAAATGTACDSSNRGDPTVVYDPIGDRWIVADFAFTSPTATPFYECIAVSMTNDPVNGGWYLYALRADDAMQPNLNDYPKMGIWTDGLYMTANMFTSSLSFAGVRVWAIDRLQLESGTLNAVIADLTSGTIFSLLPANLRGTRPPVGRDEFFTAESTIAFTYDVYTMHPDWTTPANSTFSAPTSVAQTSYYLPATSIPQPNTSTLLDSLGERMMMQTQYTHIGGVESLWVSHTTRPTVIGPTAIQWAQINVTGGTANTTPVQEQEFTNGNDGLYRWMPSIAADHQGDAAVGYSASNSSNYPSIRYAGRLAGDTLSTLGQGEATLPVSGLGNLDFNCGGLPCHRWGDYTAMTVDPVDNCTFWYVNEYYPTPDKTTVWHTRVGSFSFPGCTPYISYNQLGPDRFNSPGYGFDVTLAHTDASQQVCLRWSADGGTNWLATAACTFNSGSGTWACDMPDNITDATITYQFWIGAAGDSCAVTGDETLWTAYHSFNTGPTDVRLDSFSAVQPAAGWAYPLLAFSVLCLGGLLWLLRRPRA